MNKHEQDFKEIVGNYRRERAPLDFSKRVMDEIYQVEKLIKAQPVFNKWFLGIAGIVFLLFAGLAVWGGHDAANEGAPSRVGQAMKSLVSADLPAIDSANRSVVTFFNSVPPVLLFAMVALLLLLLLDRLLQNRKNLMKK